MSFWVHREVSLRENEESGLRGNLLQAMARSFAPVLSCLPPRLASRDAEAGESKNGSSGWQKTGPFELIRAEKDKNFRLILKNKANLPDKQIDLISAIAMIYGDFGRLKQRKNKANRRPLAGNPKHEIRNPKKVEWIRNDRAWSTFNRAWF